MGRYLCEVRAGQYWRVDNVKSFDEFLEGRFPESPRNVHYLMSVPERLLPQTRKELKEVGRTKDWSWSWRTLRGGTGRTSIVQSGLHKAHEMPTEQFKQEVGRS